MKKKPQDCHETKYKGQRGRPTILYVKDTVRFSFLGSAARPQLAQPFAPWDPHLTQPFQSRVPLIGV